MRKKTSPEKYITDRIMGMIDGGSLGAREALELTDFCHAQVALARSEERSKSRCCPECEGKSGSQRKAS